jgi:prophage regulatory protein
MPFKMLRRRDVESLVGLGRSAIYARVAAGLFPKPCKLGLKAVAWPDHEIDSLNRLTAAGGDERAIRALVSRLHASRADLAREVMP